ncbi:MAG: proton-conducting transporter membrane subunit [Candidatus Omnitrophica bacterium]|nr:proton-conducting transporter membrane subunit [Candidatus Omnitrophota bacterium]
MANTGSLLAVVFVPLAGAFILPFAGRISVFLRNLLSLIFILVSFACAVKMIPLCLQGQTMQFSLEFPLGFNFILYADSLAVFMAVVSSLLSAIIIIYSFSYIAHYENQNEYYSMVVLFLGAMMGITFSANLIFLYIFWEITAITSWRLIGFFRGKTDILRADKAFLVTVFGALTMLIGFIAIFQQTGSFDLSVIKEAVRAKPLSNVIIGLILVGILSKSATLPFHTWLPDAGVAPSPVTALLHAAILVKIGLYVFARLFVVNISFGALWQNYLPWIAGISAIISAAAALKETDLKRLIAYSTVSQIGFIFFGLAINNTIGIAGGLLYILTHGLAKAGLFLCAGIIEQNTGTKDITKLGGLIKTMPLTALAFLFCSFSVMGIPPFGGFFAKYLVFSGAISSGRMYVTALFLIGAFMTILYLFRVFSLVFLGENKIEAKEGSWGMVSSVALLAVLSLLSGVLVRYPINFLENFLGRILGAA